MVSLNWLEWLTRWLKGVRDKLSIYRIFIVGSRGLYKKRRPILLLSHNLKFKKKKKKIPSLHWPSKNWPQLKSINYIALQNQRGPSWNLSHGPHGLENLFKAQFLYLSHKLIRFHYRQTLYGLYKNVDDQIIN